MNNFINALFRPVLIPVPLLTPAPIPTSTPSIKLAGSIAYSFLLVLKRINKRFVGRIKISYRQARRADKSRVVVTRLLTAITTTLCQPLTYCNFAIRLAGSKISTELISTYCLKSPLIVMIGSY